MNFKINLAGKNILIHSKYEFLGEYCKDYVVAKQETEDFEIFISEQDIEAERVYENVASYTPQYLETVAALRKIGEQMPLYQVLLCHGALIAYKDVGAFLFTAPSGIGKSTHIGLWKQYLGEDVCILNGDKPFLKVDSSQKIVGCGSPWAGKEGWQSNKTAPLKGICLIKRGTENQIRKVAPMDALTILLHQIYIPAEKQAAEKALELIEMILMQIPVYELTCDISEDAVRCSFEALTLENYRQRK